MSTPYTIYDKYGQQYTFNSIFYTTPSSTDIKIIKTDGISQLVGQLHVSQYQSNIFINSNVLTNSNNIFTYDKNALISSFSPSQYNNNNILEGTNIFNLCSRQSNTYDNIQPYLTVHKGVSSTTHNTMVDIIASGDAIANKSTSARIRIDARNLLGKDTAGGYIKLQTINKVGGDYIDILSASNTGINITGDLNITNDYKINGISLQNIYSTGDSSGNSAGVYLLTGQLHVSNSNNILIDLNNTSSNNIYTYDTNALISFFNPSSNNNINIQEGENTFSLCSRYTNSNIIDSINPYITVNKCAFTSNYHNTMVDITNWEKISGKKYILNYLNIYKTDYIINVTYLKEIYNKLVGQVTSTNLVIAGPLTNIDIVFYSFMKIGNFTSFAEQYTTSKITLNTYKGQPENSYMYFFTIDNLSYKIIVDTGDYTNTQEPFTVFYVYNNNLYNFTGKNTIFNDQLIGDDTFYNIVYGNDLERWQSIGNSYSNAFYTQKLFNPYLLENNLFRPQQPDTYINVFYKKYNTITSNIYNASNIYNTSNIYTTSNIYNSYYGISNIYISSNTSTRIRIDARNLNNNDIVGGYIRFQNAVNDNLGIYEDILVGSSTGITINNIINSTNGYYINGIDINNIYMQNNVNSINIIKDTSNIFPYNITLEGQLQVIDKNNTNYNDNVLLSIGTSNSIITYNNNALISSFDQNNIFNLCTRQFNNIEPYLIVSTSTPGNNTLDIIANKLLIIKDPYNYTYVAFTQQYTANVKYIPNINNFTFNMNSIYLVRIINTDYDLTIPYSIPANSSPLFENYDWQIQQNWQYNFFDVHLLPHDWWYNDGYTKYYPQTNTYTSTYNVSLTQSNLINENNFVNYFYTTKLWKYLLNKQPLIKIEYLMHGTYNYQNFVTANSNQIFTSNNYANKTLYNISSNFIQSSRIRIDSLDESIKLQTIDYSASFIDILNISYSNVNIPNIINSTMGYAVNNRSLKYYKKNLNNINNSNINITNQLHVSKYNENIKMNNDLNANIFTYDTNSLISFFNPSSYNNNNIKEGSNTFNLCSRQYNNSIDNIQPYFIVNKGVSSLNSHNTMIDIISYGDAIVNKSTSTRIRIDARNLNYQNITGGYISLQNKDVITNQYNNILVASTTGIYVNGIINSTTGYAINNVNLNISQNIMILGFLKISNSFHIGDKASIIITNNPINTIYTYYDNTLVSTLLYKVNTNPNFNLCLRQYNNNISSEELLPYLTITNSKNDVSNYNQHQIIDINSYGIYNNTTMRIRLDNDNYKISFQTNFNNIFKDIVIITSNLITVNSNVSYTNIINNNGSNYFDRFLLRNDSRTIQAINLNNSYANKTYYLSTFLTKYNLYQEINNVQATYIKYLYVNPYFLYIPNYTYYNYLFTSSLKILNAGYNSYLSTSSVNTWYQYQKDSFNNEYYTNRDLYSGGRFIHYNPYFLNGYYGWSVNLDIYSCSFYGTSRANYRPYNAALWFKSDLSNNGTSLILYNVTSLKYISISFTGQHRCVSYNKNLYNKSNLYNGYIVTSLNTYKLFNSKYSPYNKKQNLAINDSLPLVDLSRVINDSSVYGVISDNYFEYSNDNSRIYENIPNMRVDLEKDIGDTRLIINGLGEGSIWVSDYNGIIESGDYITTSAIPGIGMKQDCDYLCNYTVAKITMDCDFNPSLIPLQIILTSNIVQNIILDENENPIYINQYDINSNIIYDYEYDMKYIYIDGTITTKNDYDFNHINSNIYRMAFVGCIYKCS